ncbi:hypothetical protein EYV96_17110 [Dyella terrae]|nr:hypothetical protein EYV96_17110 [Dyella terrae]
MDCATSTIRHHAHRRSRRRTVNMFAMALLSVAIVTTAHGDAPTDANWAVTLGRGDYVLHAHGSALDREGARVELTATPGHTAPTGGSMASVEATPYRGHTIKLSGAINAANAPGGAGLWLRADGPQGRLTFANTQESPVTGVTPERREIVIIVPPSATRIFFGTLLFGDGSAVVDHLSLVRGEALKPADIVSGKTELDAAISIVREHALHASSIDWDTMVPQLRSQVGADAWSQDAYPIIIRLLATLGDHHSHMVSAEMTRARRSPEGNVIVPTVEQRPEGVGYITVPGFSSQDPGHIGAFVNGGTDGITRIAGDAKHGWILDLRKDGGGNMWPMLAALRPFLGNSPLGYFRNGRELSPSWKSQLDKMHPAAQDIDLSDAPLAVITGPHTASAGEAVVIALKGRPHTRFFGAPTAGLPTGNGTFVLPDGASIALTTTVELDRAKVQYDGPLAPDVTVTPSESPEHDAAIDAAAAWLRQAVAP